MVLFALLEQNQSSIGNTVFAQTGLPPYNNLVFSLCFAPL
jgi:hypothetical protein